jgi:nitroreductase/FMN reductase [NAD(P)H]
MTMSVRDALTTRFGEATVVDPPTRDADIVWRQFAKHNSCRWYRDEPVNPNLVDTLCALALSTPTKSDMQQRDIIIARDADVRAALVACVPGQKWVADAPELLVFCGNNRRQRQIHEWRRRPYANDHLDPFFNAAVDAGIALSAFIIVAQAAGLGCCPISAIRDQAQEVSSILKLPDHVFPVAALGLGWPKYGDRINYRLPLAATVHVDSFNDEAVRDQIDAYDARRTADQPIRTQRDVDRFGEDPNYGWSEDKARQYAKPERANFGAFVRSKGFRLE